jgi:hypothetical protein
MEEATQPYGAWVKGLDTATALQATPYLSSAWMMAIDDSSQIVAVICGIVGDMQPPDNPTKDRLVGYWRTVTNLAAKPDAGLHDAPCSVTILGSTT